MSDDKVTKLTGKKTDAKEADPDTVLVDAILEKMKAIGTQPEPTRENLLEVLGAMSQHMSQQQGRIQEMQGAFRGIIKSASVGL